ncbi:MAG TPA: hypothetical protein V6C58_01065 [Allocoleopsis sp.]
MKKKPIKVLYSHLGQYKAVGLAWKEDRVIAIDKRLKGIDKIDVSIHELLHVIYPDLTEEEVTKGATEIAQVLWDMGLRFADNG